MVHTFVDSALEQLSKLNNHHSLAVSLKPQIEAFQVELRLLKMFLGCLITWDYDNSEYLVSSLESIWNKSGEGLYNAGHLASVKGKFKDWNMVASKLEEKMQHCKQNINKYCPHLISGSLQCQSFPSNQILDFLDEILNNLKHLNLPVENQIDTLEEKLLLLRNLVDFAAGRCTNGKDLSDFMIHVHTWANQAACLACLYWVNEVKDDEEIGKTLNLWLIVMLQIVNPSTPEFTGMCFAVMKSTKSSHADTFILGQFLSSFLEFLLPNLAVSLEYEFEILFEGLMFLISFLADPPQVSADDYELTLTLSQTDDVLDEASHLIFFFDDLESGRTILFGFGSKIHNLRGQIEKLYVHIPNFNFPRINGLRFVEHLLENIENLTKTMNCNPKLVPFSKHQIFRVHKELMSLGQSIHVIWELQNEHKELKDLWAQMIHVAYQAELAVNSSFTMDHPIWYHLACLSNVLAEIKDVQNEFEKFKTNQNYGNAGAAPKLPVVFKPPFSGLDEIVVGFIDEGQVLFDRIAGGTAQLDIVPIVGMGGLGKTTLARKLYNAPSVRSHFHIQAFCHVGQEHSSRNILLEILNCLIVIDDGIRAMTNDDLAHRLYKCLKGRRYLIIMDDIWDVTAWKEVKGSFPDDNNGSRVVFTTRIGNVALQAKSGCSLHYLRYFTDEESWELLQAKVFHKDPCPPDLREVGMLIVRKCSGLPLAVVVIAGLLARIPTSLSSWNRIADDLNSYFTSEGCMGTLELSYKHLPEALKPCLLYFGAFVTNKSISAKRLMLMWAAEGFLPKSMSERNSSLAKQYLNDLVDRSLVIVDSRSSTGGIKSCSVHDLMRDLCQTKSQEEHFFSFITSLRSFSMPKIYEQYRICIHSGWESFIKAEEARGCTTRTLHFAYDIAFNAERFPISYRNFTLIQLLDLQDVKFVFGYFPEEVTRLVNLRYLALAYESSVRLVHVPPIIANLWNLETFVLQTYNEVVLPETIWKMKRLRHVDVGDKVFVHLDSDVGKDSSKLPNVESFSCVTINEDVADGEELLRRLPNARKLRFRFLSSWNPLKKCRRLPTLDHLRMLESLNIVSMGSWYPCVFSFPATLKKLSLSFIYLPGSEFGTIIAKQLPCLEVLKLICCVFMRRSWDMEEVEFPRLKYLELCFLDVGDWIASVDSFPCLERLVVKHCYYLEKIPACFGEVPTMKAIEVHGSSSKIQIEIQKESAIEIQKEQREMGNESFEVGILE